MSYKLEWAGRARCAASLLPDNATVLEIGVGAGLLKELVKHRTKYIGADLEPLDAESIPLDLDSDPLPDKRFDYIVLLGVFEYLHQPEVAAKKICNAASYIITSYCCRRKELTPQVVRERRRRGWINSFDQAEFKEIFTRHGHEPSSFTLLNATDEFEQFLAEFRRSNLATSFIDDQGAGASRHDGTANSA